MILAATLLTLPFAHSVHETEVVRRHDRADADYLQLALDYGQTCHVGLDGVGVLIAPRWILTAAHVARDLTFFEPTVRFLHADPDRGRRARVDRVVLHPGFLLSPREIDHDIALVRLAEPVDWIEPVPILRAGVERDLLFTLVGDGDLGTGATGAVGNDGRWRGATNRPVELRENALVFRFDAPGDAACTELEGFWGPGDSGTPAFVESAGKRYVAGIGSHGQSSPAGVVAGYGARDVSYRVSHYAPWIDAVLAEHAQTPPAIVEPLRFDADALSATSAGECLVMYFETLTLADAEMRALFAETFATARAAETPGERLWLLDELREHASRLVPLRQARTEAGFDVLARSGESDQAFVLRFRFEPEESRLDEVRMIPVLLRATEQKDEDSRTD